MWYGVIQTGDRHLDDQLRNIDSLLTLCENSDIPDTKIVQAVIPAIRKHLEFEELLSDERGYNMSPGHKLKHEQITSRLGVLQEIVEKEHPNLSQIVAEIDEMLAIHALEYDSLLTPEAQLSILDRY